MKMIGFLSTFYQSEDGAITVDFVALTAAIVLLGFLVVTAFNDEAIAIANWIGDTVASQPTK